MGKVDSWSSRGQEVSHRSIVLDLECTKRHRHKTVVSTHPNKMGERNKKSPDLEVVHVSKRHPLDYVEITPLAILLFDLYR